VAVAVFPEPPDSVTEPRLVPAVVQAVAVAVGPHT
jgi:hypothetical protein